MDNRTHEQPTDHLGDNLAAYLDGALGADEAAALRAHLRACAPCRAAVAAHQRLDQQMHAWGGVEPRFAPLPYSARQALRARVPALARRARPPHPRMARLAGALGGLMLFVLGGGLLVAPAGGKPPGGTAAPPQHWNTFAGHLGRDLATTFRVDYPGDWNLTQMELAQAGMSVSLRFSTYKPSLVADAQPSPDEAEIWLAVGQGSLAAGWPAREVAGLRAAGYQERAYQVGNLLAVRFTDALPHAGLYDAVYLPLGNEWTARLHLSTAAARYQAIFDLMLASVQVGGVPVTPTPGSRAPRQGARSDAGGTASLGGTLAFLAATPQPLLMDDACVNAAHFHVTQP